MQAISFLLSLHLNVWFPGCHSCLSIDSSWRNEVEINHIAILNSFPPANMFPGLPRPISIFFIKKRKVFRQSLKIFLHFFMLSRPTGLAKATGCGRSRKSRYIHCTCTNKLQTCAVNLTLWRSISATTHFVESIHTARPSGQPNTMGLTPFQNCKLTLCV